MWAFDVARYWQRCGKRSKIGMAGAYLLFLSISSIPFFLFGRIHDLNPNRRQYLATGNAHTPQPSYSQEVISEHRRARSNRDLVSIGVPGAVVQLVLLPVVLFRGGGMLLCLISGSGPKLSAKIRRPLLIALAKSNSRSPVSSHVDGHVSRQQQQQQQQQTMSLPVHIFRGPYHSVTRST